MFPIWIVWDGRRRADQAAWARVRDEVEGSYAEEIRQAGGWRLALLRLKVRREIRRRLDQMAPDDALYAYRGHEGDGKR